MHPINHMAKRTSWRKKLVNIAHSGTRDQYRKELETIVKDGVCPFCGTNLKKYHRNPILKTTHFWMLTENDHPYDGTKQHLVFILKKHAEHISELSPKEFADLSALVYWAVRKYRLRGGSLFIRFGDTDYTGSSVAHLHAQMVSGYSRTEGGEKLAVKLGYKRKPPRKR